MILSPSGVVAALLRVCLWSFRGFLGEGANPNLKEKQRFTLKISAACKAGVWGLFFFRAEVCLLGNTSWFVPVCKPPKVWNSSFPSAAFLPHYTCKPLLFLPCGVGSVEVIQKNKKGSISKSSPAWLREAGWGWEGGERGCQGWEGAERGLSPPTTRETHFPVGTWVSTLCSSASA